MRSHDTLSTSKDDHERDERRDFPAHSVHGGHGAPAIARLVEHTAVPMPPPEAPVRTMSVPIQTMFDRRGSEAAMASKLDAHTSPETDDDDDEEPEETPRDSQRPTVPAKDQVPHAPAPRAEQYNDASSAEEGLLQVPQGRQPIYDISTLPPSADSPNIQHAEFLGHTEITGTEPLEAISPHPHQFEVPVDTRPDNEAPQTTFTAPRTQAVPPSQPSFSKQHNTAPLPPPPPAATGSQPPSPPIFPPVPPSPAYPNPGNPNLPPSMNTPLINGVNAYNQSPTSANTHNQSPQLPNYNAIPVPPASRRGVDMLARIGVVGNFLGNRKTRRTLNKKIELGQQKAAASFAELQTQNQAMKAEQARQAQELQKVRATPAERFAPASNKTESLPPIAANPNVRPMARPEAAAVVPIAAEQQQADPNQPIELQAKQHFERSAWHSIVVDEKGREVKGAMPYGEEFKQQRKETISDSVGMGLGTATPTITAAQGSSSNHGQPIQQPTLPSGMTAPVLPQGLLTHIDPQHQLPAKSKKSDVVPGPVFWVMLIVILAAFFAAASF